MNIQFISTPMMHHFQQCVNSLQRILTVHIGSVFYVTTVDVPIYLFQNKKE